MMERRPSQSRLRHLLPAMALALLAACSGTSPDQDAEAAFASGEDWPGYGRTSGQDHYSPLEDVNRENVEQLGLIWSYDLPLGNSAIEPVEVNDVLYFAHGLSIVKAVDARTAELLWSYDPEVGKVAGMNLRMAWGVRGVAWADGKVFTGTSDGRLIAIDASNGEPVWSEKVFGDQTPGNITGAPRVFGKRVLIGFGGDGGAIRGKIVAFDRDSGEKLWEFHSVPGNPADGFENEAMEMAAKTWHGEWWKYGGGATVWNSIAHDPELDLIYFGTGSPYPWNHRIRSNSKGDNLFANSIVAVDAATGEYRWHYQTVPGDTWDFDATMDVQLAEIEHERKPRKVLMQAPKNGFFYVIDRETGELLSAKPIVEVNWASQIDLKTGRPVENPEARFERTGKDMVIKPTALAAHNWLPMAYSPQSKLVYIPIADWEARYGDINGEWEPPTTWISGDTTTILGGPLAGMPVPQGYLIAWSPSEQREIWRVKHPTYMNGGVLATGGSLIFQGTVDGYFRAYDADTGKTLWEYDAKAPLMAPPISYRVGGRQYVTIVTGLGMAYALNFAALSGPEVQKYGIDPRAQSRRVLTFALGGTAQLPERNAEAEAPADPDFKPDPKRIMAGALKYQDHCFLCHGALAIGAGNGPDLRRSSVPLDAGLFAKVVREGLLEERGMPKFSEMSAEDLENMRQYIRAQAAQLRDGKSIPPAAPPKSMAIH